MKTHLILTLGLFAFGLGPAARADWEAPLPGSPTPAPYGMYAPPPPPPVAYNNYAPPPPPGAYESYASPPDAGCCSCNTTCCERSGPIRRVLRRIHDRLHGCSPCAATSCSSCGDCCDTCPPHRMTLLERIRARRAARHACSCDPCCP